MSCKQENLTDNEISTSKIKKSFSSKTNISAKNQKPFETNARTDGNLKLVSPSKSKFFMPKPRISSHCKGEPAALNNRLHVKSMIDFKHCSLQQMMVAEEAHYFSTKSKELIDVNAESISLKNEENEVANSKATSDMLAITISCVMLMASKLPTISDEYLSWSEHYLSHIKDKNGNHPPNVQGILNHIQYLRIKEVVPESSTPNNKIKCSCVSDIRRCSNCEKQSDKNKSSGTWKCRYSSASENNNRKHVSSIKRTSSCSTFTGVDNSNQITK